MSTDETVRAYDLDAQAYADAVRSGIAGKRSESWLELSAVRDEVSS